jgi:hypothetical protein
VRATPGTFDDDRFAGCPPTEVRRQGRPGGQVSSLSRSSPRASPIVRPPTRSAAFDRKYDPGMEPTDPGFGSSDLREFRARPVVGVAERLSTKAMLETFKAHVLAAIHTFDCMELAGEASPASLHRLATATQRRR